jgi:hypothetical protein
MQDEKEDATHRILTGILVEADHRDGDIKQQQNLSNARR